VPLKTTRQHAAEEIDTKYFCFFWYGAAHFQGSSFHPQEAASTFFNEML
jgi:hypothetical protein